MTIAGAQTLLDAGQTLELDLPPRDKYMAALYHALVKQGQYTCSVFYPGVSIKWETLFASADWATFLAHLPTSLRQGTEWRVM